MSKFLYIPYFPASDILKEVELPLISPIQCEAAPFHQDGVTNNIICAGGIEGEGVCQVSINYIQSGAAPGQTVRGAKTWGADAETLGAVTGDGALRLAMYKNPLKSYSYM